LIGLAAIAPAVFGIGTMMKGDEKMYYEQNTTTIGGFYPGFWRTCRDVSAMPLVHLAQGIRQYLHNRRDYRTLLEAPDYLLDDMGLTRDQVIAMTKPLFFR
jgi:uncharacterized protein YjiS (DUF1127 family)